MTPDELLPDEIKRKLPQYGANPLANPNAEPGGVVGPQPTAPPAPAAPPPAAAPPSPALPSTFDRATAPGQWQATGNDLAKQDALLKAWGMGPLSANGTGTLPDGSVMDLRRGAKAGDNTAIWMGAGGAGAGAMGGGSSGDGALGGAGASGGGSYQDQIRQLILGQLQGLSKPVDANDPQIAAEMSAQGRVLDRQAQQARAQAAERAAFQGLLNGGAGSGSFDTTLQGINEQKGEALTGLQAQLFGRTIQQNQSRLNQLLNMALQSGDAESARALQLRIAQMDEQLRRLGLSQQASQWGETYGLDKAAAEYQRDRDVARAKSGLPF